MKLVVFGLTVSSSWGNGHATLWRGLCSSMARRGHKVIFFERNLPWYATSRDLSELPGGGELVIYEKWEDVIEKARRHLRDCDAAMVTSYCPDGIPASRLVLEDCRSLRIFYDLDAPVTLSRIALGEDVAYVGPERYSGFDLALSYTGGKAFDELIRVMGARRVQALYGSVDPAVHSPAAPVEYYRSALSYMGTYSADRDEALNALFIEPARQLSRERFVIGGSKYHDGFPWLPNIYYVGHLPPAQHSEFYCSGRLTVNVTRLPMAEMGFCPSGRLFEASACGVPVLSDYWEGLDTFYTPGSEILIGREPNDALHALSLSDAELASIGRNARQRTLDCHTSDHRARELEDIIASSDSRDAREAVTSCGE